jgi:hypothetical protein
MGNERSVGEVGIDVDRGTTMAWSSRSSGHARQLKTLVAGVLALMACAAVTLSGATASRAATAHAARTFSLRESARLRLTSTHKLTLNEEGSASGTIAGTIYIHLDIASTNHVTAEVNIYPRGGGSLTGYASASYRPNGAVAIFDGTMYIARGTGGYSHDHGSGLSFSGTVQRINDAVSVNMSGALST